jgi:hypothetical protein
MKITVYWRLRRTTVSAYILDRCSVSFEIMTDGNLAHMLLNMLGEPQTASEPGDG